MNTITTFELSQWLIWICAAGAVCALLGALGYFFVAAQAGSRTVAYLPAKFSTIILIVACIAGLGTLWVRYQEVNHFPSQTMHEVIMVYAVTTLIAGVIIRAVLGWKRYGCGAEGLGYLLQMLILGTAGLVLAYSLTLTTTQRDLPPALQSYWFAPHLSALILSYGTLVIAALLAYLYFAFNAARGIFAGGVSKRAIWGTLAFTFLVPWSHLVTIPIFLLVLLIAAILHYRGKGFDWLPNWGKVLDEQSFRIFAVGFPFFTAGLMMGALWAQEAWANYWGWDSKEVSALLTWIVYLIYLHLRFVAGWRGPKVMKVLIGGAISIFITFQLFSYLPDSQKSLHRYTDPQVTPQEGMQGS